MRRTLFSIALLSFLIPVATPPSFAGSAPAEPAVSAPPVEFRGIFMPKDGECFSLSVQGGKRRYWIGVGETQGGVKVTGYDRDHGVLSVNYQGKDYALRLASPVNDGLPLKPIPRFARPAQVVINGWENLAKLSPERRRHALAKINALLEAFDKSVGPLSKKQLNQAEQYEAKESKEQKEDEEEKQAVEEAEKTAAKEAAKEAADEAAVKPTEALDEKNFPKPEKAVPTPEETPADSPSAESDEMENSAEENESDTAPGATKTDDAEDGLTANPANMMQQLTIEVNEAPGGSASVFIDDWQDTGGAHGNHEFSVMNFIGTDTAPAPLSALLAGVEPNGPALSRLSGLSELSILKSGFTPEKSGLAPEVANFSNIMLTPYGLRVLFPPYQVGSFADGTKKAYIPAASLNGVVSPKVRSLWAGKEK